MNEQDFSKRMREVLREFCKKNNIDDYTSLDIDNNNRLREFLLEKFPKIDGQPMFASARAQIKSLINFANKGIYDV